MAQANSPSENVRALQRALYVAAKRNGGRKFPALLDRIARPDVLRDAWEQVRRNQGAAGIDGETLAAVEAYGWSGCWGSCVSCCWPVATGRSHRGGSTSLSRGGQARSARSPSLGCGIGWLRPPP